MRMCGVIQSEPQLPSRKPFSQSRKFRSRPKAVNGPRNGPQGDKARSGGSTAQGYTGVVSVARDEDIGGDSTSWDR